MMLCEDVISSPGSPPGMTASKSSKSSSFHSLHSDDNSVLDDASHFEDIGLEDDGDGARLGVAVAVQAKVHSRQSWSPDLRPEKHVTARAVTLARPPARSLSTGNKIRPSAGAHLRVNTRPSLPVIPSNGREPRGLVSRSTGSLPMGQRSRSPSPSLSVASTGGLSVMSNRRTSWQSAQGNRKSVAELERECDDDDDDDDIPEHMVLSNVPISPRPPTERSASSRGSSPSPARDKERVKKVGNGTPAVAQAQGSLKSPDFRPDPNNPVKARAKSWNAAMAELSAEAKALTEKLEEHAHELEEQMAKKPNARPKTWEGRRRSLDGSKNGENGAPLGLPPVQRSIMIDPLPISKEKEAVLSRTRPSWLPPKDPAEEKKHLREYQRMMAHSVELERRKEAQRNAQTASKEATAGNLMKTWEQDVIPRWDMAIRERKTRQLWWKGVPPRSRGVVWTRAIGNSLELTETSYQAALGRAHQVETRVQGARSDCEDGVKVAWFNQIRKDVSENTWADLRIFQPSGPLHQSLVDVLCAYAMYRSDIGYVPGCHTIAALLLLNLPSPPAAFIALANLLNRPLPLSFYSEDRSAKASVYNLVMQTLSRRSEALHFHLVQTLRDIDPDEYLGRVFRSLFTGHLGMDESARLWDVYVFEGDSVFVRAAVAFLMEREMALLSTKTAAEISEVLSRAGVGTRQRAVGEAGSEDKWMEAVQEAGR